MNTTAPPPAHDPFLPAVVLMNPTQDGNIGATARAMANFGLWDLRLVAPAADHTSLFCRQMASGANHVLDTLQVFPTLAQALADREKVYATSARHRNMIKPVMSPRHSGALMADFYHKGRKTAFLFGTEASGLTNEAIALADAVVHINLSPDHASLNLSQAVLLLAYEWYQAWQERPEQEAFLQKGTTRFASQQDIDTLFVHLEKELDQANFWRTPTKKPIMAQSLRNIFLRCGLTHQETQTLRGVIQALVYYRWQKNPKEGPLS